MAADRLLLSVIAIVLALAPSVARAQNADAEALFQEGRRLLKDGKIAEACAKLDASERLESSVGTLLNLADCREKNGEIATAWATFVKAAGEARRADHDEKREKEAARRAHALEARVPYLTVSVPDTSQVDGLTVLRAGAPLDPELWNTSVPVDPGHYEITAQAPGREPWTTAVDVAEGQKVSVEVPRFKSVGELTPDAPPPVIREPLHDHEEPPPPPGPEIERSPRRFAWIAVGAAAVSLGAVAGGLARGAASRSLERQSDALCGSTCSDSEGLRLNRDAGRAALEADALFAAGGVAAAGAVILWMVGAPRDIEVAPTAGGAVIGVAGSF